MASGGAGSARWIGDNLGSPGALPCHHLGGCARWSSVGVGRVTCGVIWKAG
jgi:hypothetical protein